MDTAEILSALDEQIKRLQAARSLLQGGTANHNSIGSPGGSRRGPRHMSAAARKRISEAQKARWAKQKATKKK